MKTRRDYRGIEFPTMISDLDELRHKLECELDTDGMINELEVWAKGDSVDVDAMTDDLVEHIDVLGEMRGVCEEMLRSVGDVEFDE
ncbi:hypothetical protein [Porphyromonas asaccharolytica]|uniref:hypothetical protein n=1 Tax=Porphyromonas asaccharolytica TaxID=28123 RepID=UPI00248ED6F5|nr:hypothetical protein [Porphyromonas asaccharolytica]